MMSIRNRPYSDYFSIDEGYYPEINPNSVKDPKNDWFKTFPHPKFVELLEKLERMMARETAGRKHCIWVQGAFGTGKSRVVWAIQQLMACTDEKFKAYFQQYDALRQKTDLRDKLLGHKHGRVVTAFRYASGDINSDKRLITAVYDSITDALKKGGYDYIGENTLRGRIAAWLQIERNAQYFLSIIQDPKYRGMGSFAGKTPGDIINQLQGSGNSDLLIHDLLTVMENEQICIYDLSIEDLKAWISDVIDRNQITALLFLWDEFSSFFKLNRDALDVFQSLLELCAEKPFEMIIVTHMAGSIAIDGQVRTVSDRFEQVEIEMPDNVAFELIGHAMRPDEPAHGFSDVSWQAFAEDLASRTPDARKAVADAVGVPDSVLRNMIPIHPMAALMLKHISENFASNQRSMFNFIKHDDSDDLQAFQWFIQRYSPENGDLLTIDFLWNFFYEKGRDEHQTGTGRSNLDTIIAGVLDTYPQNRARLNEEQQRVLKVVLMMQAISRKLNNAVPLLRPTEKNIALAFEGDENFSTMPVHILKNQLVAQLRILFTTPTGSGVDEYATATVQGDQVRIDAIIERIRRETRTARLIKDAELSDAIRWSDAVRMRFHFATVCVDNFTVEMNKLLSMPADYHIYGMVCFARTEEEQARLLALITQAREDEEKRNIVIIDASSMIMGLDRFEDWVKYAGNEEYWRSKDAHLADNHLSHLQDQLRDWKAAVGAGVFHVYYKTLFVRGSHSARQLNEEVLPRIVLDCYPWAFDNAPVSESFFQSNKLQDGARRSIEGNLGSTFQQSCVLPMMRGVWGITQYWTIPANADLPIVKLKKELDAFILERFETDIRISHVDIYAFLTQRGFTPCNLYAFLTGFLLKEYAQEPYRYSIGESGEEGDAMNAEKLSSHIAECMKHQREPIRGYKMKYIEIMSVEQKAFVDFVAEAFGVPANLSVEKAASRMRIKLKELRYPIWCFKMIDSNNLDAYIDLIADIANDRGSDNVPSLARRFGKMLLDVQSSSRHLIELLTQENGANAMMVFLDVFRDGQILTLAREIQAPDLLADVRSVLSSGEALWLWHQEMCEEELDKLITEYSIVRATNRIPTFVSTHSYSSCMREWKACASDTHIPYRVICERRTELRQWATLLSEVVPYGAFHSYENKRAFLVELDNQRSAIADFLAHRQEAFASYFASNLIDLSGESAELVYARMPQTSFTDSKSDFVRRLNDLVAEARANQKKTKLQRLWKELCGFDNPKEWSFHYRTPIMAIIPPSEQEDARKLFVTLLSGSPSESDINASMRFLESSPAFLTALKDQAMIDEAFRRELIRKYRSLVTVTEARDEISARCSAEPYEWLSGSLALSIVREKADNVYQSGANESLLSLIDGMDASRAKDYLKRLVRDKLDVGIEMMNEEGVQR